MSVESRIISAIAFTGYPCESGKYTGTATTYFVMMVDFQPANFSNDTPGHQRCSITLHLVAPMTFDHTTVRKSIKDALFAAGFSYPTEIDASGARESDGVSERRIIFEAEYIEVV